MLTTFNFSYDFQLMPFQKIFYSCKILYPTFLHGWLQTFYLSTLLKLNFFSLDFRHNFLKFTIPHLTISSNTTIQPVSFARNLGIIFDSNISFSDHISYISKSCFSHIRDLRRIRNTLDHKTACTIATSLIHSKLDYCNSLYLNISNQQLNRLQLVLNSAARAVTKTPKFHHITPHLKSLHWLKITQRIQYKSFTNLQVTSVQQTFLHFWSSPYNQLVLPAHLQLSLSNALQIPLGSKFLTDLSTFKRLHFGMLYHTIFALSFSFFSISFSSLAIFFSIPQAAENSLFSSFLSSLAYLLSTGLTPWNFDLACLSFIIHSISFILDPFICSIRFNFMFVI